MEAPLPGLEGKYQLLAKLREGGMGAIYKVRHRLLDEVRVVKVMKPQLAGDATFAERFLREAQAAARLRHPNIAQVYDFAVGEDGSAFIVMEYIDGLDLGQLLKREALPPVATVLEIGIQALDALEFLHRNHFVHRDISPDNLMIRDRTGGGGTEVKLIDLGIAKNLGQGGGMTQAGEFLGKFHYASPEHFGGQTGDREVEPRSDLYSLGLVLYELLTGERAYLGKEFSALTAAHLLKPPRAFDETDPGGRISPRLRALILKALAKDPEGRFADAAAMRAELQAIRKDWRDEDEAGWTVAGTLLMDRGAPEAEGPTMVPGSTQDRLDREFPREAGSAQAPLAAVPPAPSEAPAARPGGRRAPFVWAGAVAGLLVLVLAGWWAFAREGPRRPDLAAPADPSGSGVTASASEPWEIEADAGAVEALPGPQRGEISAGDPADREELLASMREAHESLQRAEGSDRPADRKAEAWRRFLDTYSEDVPDTAEDEEIRAYARRRLGYWEGQAAALAAQQVERDSAARARAREAEREVAAAPAPPVAPVPSEPGPETPRERIDSPEEARRFLAVRGIPISEASLRQAVGRDEPDAVRILLLADPGVRPKTMETILEDALQQGKLQAADAIVRAGFQPSGGLLEEAAGRGRLDLVRFLAERGIGDREDALEEAFDERHWRVARYLMEGAGVPLSAADDEAEECFVALAEKGDLEGVLWLLRAGIDVRSGVGEDAVEEAEDNGHGDVAAAIRRARGGGP